MSNLKNIILYSTPTGNIEVEVVFNKHTFWLSQKAMATLLAVEVPAISKHLKNIFETNELALNSVVSKMETTATDGKKYQTTFYRLEAVLAVGYRVNSTQATQFRIWATNTLKEFIIKGFILDDERVIKGKDDLLSDEFDKFISTNNISNVSDLQSLRYFFYAYITDPTVRAIIDQQDFTELYHNPTFNVDDFSQVDDEMKRFLPMYVKTYVPLNKFIS